VKNNDTAPERFSLKRWSARKLDAARQTTAAPAPEVAPLAVVSPPASANVPASGAPTAAETPALPPVDALTFDSDFTAFLQQGVAEPLKRQALKKLFHDPRFNVMDGLDVYIDDYSIPSPLEPELVEQLLHARFTLNPPVTRVNEAGVVEEVPEGAAAAQAGDAAALTSPDVPSSDASVHAAQPVVAAVAPDTLPAESAASPPAPVLPDGAHVAASDP